MPETLHPPEKSGRGWSVNSGEFNPVLHVPSQAVLEYVSRVEPVMPEEVQRRVIALLRLKELSESADKSVA